MVQFLDNPQCHDLRAVERSICGVHPHDRPAQALHKVLQVVKAPLGQEWLQLLCQLSSVVESFEPLIEAGIGREAFGIEYLAEGLPGLVLIAPVREEVRVFTLEAVVWRFGIAREWPCSPRIWGGFRGDGPLHNRYRGIKQRGFHPLAFARQLARVQGRENTLTGSPGCIHRDNIGADSERRFLRSP